MRKTSEIKMFPETHQITPQSTISVQTYNEAASLLEQTLNITVPGPQKIDMEFMSEKLFDVLQYDSTKFHTAEEREQASQQKYAAQLLMEQVRFNRTQIEHNHSNTNQNTQQVHQEKNQKEAKNNPPIIEEQKVNNTITEEKHISENLSILHTPTHIEIEVPEITIRETKKEKINEESYTEKEKIEHEDLAIIEEKDSKTVTITQMDKNPDINLFNQSFNNILGSGLPDDKMSDGLIVENFIKQYGSDVCYQQFVDIYKKENERYRFQTISADHHNKSERKPIKEILAEVKANMNK